MIGLRAARLACPYCRATFAERDISFRCSGRTGPDGRRCEAEPDDALGRWLNDARRLPPVFTADGRQPSATCPDCGESTREHVCPHCRRRLPYGFAQADHWPVAIVGPAQSGKTVFLTVLLHELSHQLGAAAGVAVRGLDEETLRAFHADYDHPLFDQHTLPKPSDPLAVTPPRSPLVFELAQAGPGWPGWRRRRVIASFLDLNDLDLADPVDRDRVEQQLTSARVIILVLDPLQLPGSRGYVRPEAIGSERAGPAGDRPVALLTRVIGPLGEPGRRDGVIRKPVAVVMTKLDAVEEALPAGSPLTVRPALRPRFDVRDGDAVDTQVRHLIDKWDGPQFNLNLRARFTRYRYFGVSALGGPPRDPATVRVVVPHRMHDVALWLLREFGAAGVTSPRGSRRS